MSTGSSAEAGRVAGSAGGTPTLHPELFRDKAVLVTGGTSGIGDAVARAFIADGPLPAYLRRLN